MREWDMKQEKIHLDGGAIMGLACNLALGKFPEICNDDPMI